MSDIVSFIIYLFVLQLGWPARKWYYRSMYLNSNHWKKFSRRMCREHKQLTKKVDGRYACPVRGCDKTNLTIHHKRGGYDLWFEREKHVVPLCWGHHLVVENGQDVELRSGEVIEGYKKWRT